MLYFFSKTTLLSFSDCSLISKMTALSLTLLSLSSSLILLSVGRIFSLLSLFSMVK